MNIIVASNHLFCRELSSYLLDQAGYTVYEASDSTALLDILCQIPIHLVLLDTGYARPDLHGGRPLA